MLTYIHIQDTWSYCSKFKLSHKHPIHILRTVCDWVIIWEFINFTNNSFDIVVHAIIIVFTINEILLVVTHDQLTHFYCSTELFPQKIRVICKISEIRIIHYGYIGIDGIKIIIYVFRLCRNIWLCNSIIIIFEGLEWTLKNENISLLDSVDSCGDWGDVVYVLLHKPVMVTDNLSVD